MLGFGAIGQFAIGEVETSVAGGAEFIGPDKYMVALSEPVRRLLGVETSAMPVFAMLPLPVVSFSWFAPMSEPTRKLPRSPAVLAPFFSFQPAPSPCVATGWFEPLSEPVRFLPGLKPAATPYFAYQDEPVTVTPFSWFSLLSEPVRKLPRLNAAQQQFFASDPTVIPVTTFLSGWFTALGEPVRYKIGLAPPLQQFYAAPSRLLPNADLIGILNAIETKDVFLAGAAIFNRPVDGELGVQNMDRSPAELSLSGQPATITARMSISII